MWQDLKGERKMSEVRLEEAEATGAQILITACPLCLIMMEDARNITLCTHLLFCSKNIERIGDHATNIAETVVYLVSGETLPLERPKGSLSLKQDDTHPDSVK